jgi:hypothetical protein
MNFAAIFGAIRANFSKEFVLLSLLAMVSAKLSKKISLANRSTRIFFHRCIAGVMRGFFRVPCAFPERFISSSLSSCAARPNLVSFRSKGGEEPY